MQAPLQATCVPTDHGSQGRRIQLGRRIRAQLGRACGAAQPRGHPPDLVGERRPRGASWLFHCTCANTGRQGGAACQLVASIPASRGAAVRRARRAGDTCAWCHWMRQEHAGQAAPRSAASSLRPLRIRLRCAARRSAFLCPAGLIVTLPFGRLLRAPAVSACCVRLLCAHTQTITRAGRTNGVQSRRRDMKVEKQWGYCVPGWATGAVNLSELNGGVCRCRAHA